MLGLIKKILGEKKFKRFRQIGYRVKYFINKPMNENEFQNFLLKEMKILSGDTLFIHSSMDKLNVSFSAGKLLQILQKVVGSEGTLMFPAWHFNYRAEEYLVRSSNIFNVRKSFSVMGLLTEIARREPGAKRSLHPTNSIVAIGKNAEDLLKDHHKSIYPNGEMSPFYKMMNYGGKVVGLGEQAMHSLSFVHCIEDVYQDKFPYPTRTDLVFKAKVIDMDGVEQTVQTKAAHVAIGKRNVFKYLKENFGPDEICNYSKRGSNFFVVNSRDFYRKMESLTDKGITIYS